MSTEEKTHNEFDELMEWTFIRKERLHMKAHLRHEESSINKLTKGPEKSPSGLKMQRWTPQNIEFKRAQDLLMERKRLRKKRLRIIFIAITLIIIGLLILLKFLL
jgi:hypothetical protein